MFKVGDKVISISEPDFYGPLVITNTDVDSIDGTSISVAQLSDLENGSWWEIKDLRLLTKLEKAMK